MCSPPSRTPLRRNVSTAGSWEKRAFDQYGRPVGRHAAPTRLFDSILLCFLTTLNYRTRTTALPWSGGDQGLGVLPLACSSSFMFHLKKKKKKKEQKNKRASNVTSEGKQGQYFGFGSFFCQTSISAHGCSGCVSILGGWCVSAQTRSDAKYSNMEETHTKRFTII